MVPTAEVQLCEKASIEEFIQEFVNHRNREHVADGLQVQSMVVHEKAPRVILLLDEQNQRGEHRSAGLDDALLHHVTALALEFVFYQLGVLVRANDNQPRAWL
jgi:hypothetical protein